MRRPTTSTTRLPRGRPFTRAEALAAGADPRSLHGPGVRRLHHGVYLDASTPVTPEVWVAAALLVHPATAYASHASAARLCDLPVSLPVGEHISVVDRRDRRRPRTFRHHLAPPEPDVRVVKGLRASGPEQLFCELAGQLGLVDLVVAGDVLVDRYGTTPERLVSAAERAPTKLRALARRAAGLVRRGVESPMETRLRLLLVLAGLPEPEVNVVVRRADGRVRYRFDLCYPRWRLVVEYDGRHHRADLGQWDHDIARRDWMDAEGWSFVPVVARGIYRRPDETVQRVHGALLRAGATGLPRRLSEEWRNHFPVVP